ncbi:MAG: hypothetical protein WEB60_05580 [Terrimicrobiaceae bacterium]
MSEIPPPVVRRSSPWITLLVIFVIFIAIAGGLWWWFTRPIQPVVLSPQELATVEQKVAAIQSADPVAPPPPSQPPASAPSGSGEPSYERGKKEIVLTEREINGLLNANTDLGQSISFQLGTDVILTRIETDLDPDLPFIGGRTFKARAKFVVSEGGGQPSFVIDDLTVWGISLPNEWLGGLKGRNLFAEILGSETDGKLPGVESFSIRPGQISIKLKE